MQTKLGVGRVIALLCVNMSAKKGERGKRERKGRKVGKGRADCHVSHWNGNDCKVSSCHGVAINVAHHSISHETNETDIVRYLPRSALVWAPPAR